MLFTITIFLCSIASALQPSRPGMPEPAPIVRPEAEHLHWTIDGLEREAIIYIPAAATKSATPVIFAFHGHGGNSRYSAAKFDYQKHWPEAISVYMQGLPTKGRTDPEGTRNGWQGRAGELGDRDLKFFDAVLASLRKDYKLDERRIYATGHSNGGGFTYLLWAERGDVFAAVAPAAGGLRAIESLHPKPAMHIAGERDTTVPFKNQQRTMERVRTLNGCDAAGTDWGKGCTLYPSKTGTPFVSMVYPGDHKFPDEAPAMIVKFFREQIKPETPAPATPPVLITPAVPGR